MPPARDELDLELDEIFAGTALEEEPEPGDTDTEPVGPLTAGEIFERNRALARAHPTSDRGEFLHPKPPPGDEIDAELDAIFGVETPPRERSSLSEMGAIPQEGVDTRETGMESVAKALVRGTHAVASAPRSAARMLGADIAPPEQAARYTQPPPDQEKGIPRQIGEAAVESLPQLLPSIGLRLLPAVGLPAQALFSFSMEGGSAYEDSIKEGMDEADARTVGITSGILNAALESVFPGTVAKTVSGPALRSLSKAALRVTKGMGEEGITEFAQTYVPAITRALVDGGLPAARKAITDPDTFLEGIISAGAGAVVAGPISVGAELSAARELPVREPRTEAEPEAEPAAEPKQPPGDQSPPGAEPGQQQAPPPPGEQAPPGSETPPSGEEPKQEQAEPEPEEEWKPAPGRLLERGPDETPIVVFEGPQGELIPMTLDQAQLSGLPIEGFDDAEQEEVIEDEGEATEETGPAPTPDVPEVAPEPPAEKPQIMRQTPTGEWVPVEDQEEEAPARPPATAPKPGPTAAAPAGASSPERLDPQALRAERARKIDAELAAQRANPRPPKFTPQVPTRPAAATPERPKVAAERRGQSGRVAVIGFDEPVEYEWAAVDVRDLVTSHDDRFAERPDYPQEMQPRDRSREGYQAQVEDIAKKLDPNQLLESSTAAQGAPIVSDDSVVESGNGRSMALRRAYSAGGPRIEAYRAAIEEHAGKVGVDLSGIEQPVLVRIRKNLPGGDRVALTRKMQKTGVAQMSPSEQARADAEGMTPEALENLRTNADGELSIENSHEFVRRFMQGVAEEERGALQDSKGRLSNDGQKRIERAIMARAYKDPDLLDQVIESKDDNIRTVGKALLHAAPAMVQMQESIRLGAVAPEHDITKPLADASLKLSELRRSKTRIIDYMLQAPMSGERELDPFTEEILGVFGGHAATLARLKLVNVERSAKKIGDILNRYAELVASEPDPRQGGLFGGGSTTPARELFARAAADVAAGREPNLFSDQEEGAGGGAALSADPSAFGKRDRGQSRKEPGRRRPRYADMVLDIAADRQLTPEVRKLLMQIVRAAHPDRLPADQKERGTAFLKAANSVADRNDLDALKSIWEAWERGDVDPPPVSYGRTRYRPQPPPRPQQPPPPRRPPPPGAGSSGGGGARRPPPPPPGGAAGPPPPGTGPQGSAFNRRDRGRPFWNEAKLRPRRKVDTARVSNALDLPEIVQLLRDLAGGSLPLPLKVMRQIIRPGVLGRFRMADVTDVLERLASRRIDILAALGQDPDQAARVLAHEIFHWIDSAPDAWLKRGNVLNHIAATKRFYNDFIDELMTDPTRVLTAAEKRAMRAAARTSAEARLGPNAKQKDVEELASEIYRDNLELEVRGRRLVDLATVRDEMIAVATTFKPIPSDAPAKYIRYRLSPEELYADVGSALVVAPALVQEHAPTFASLFDNYMEARPEVARAWLSIQERASRSRAERVSDREGAYLNMIDLGAITRARAWLNRKRNPSFRETVRNLGQALTDAFITEDAELERHIDAARKRARREGRQWDEENNPLWWVEEDQWIMGPQAAFMARLNDLVLAPLEAAGVSRNDFGAWLALRRAATDREALHNPLGETGRFAAEVMRSIEQRLGAQRALVVQEAGRVFSELWQNTIVGPVIASGMVSPETAQKMRDSPNYVRFYVQTFMENEAAGSQRDLAHGSLRHQIGTFQGIGNPLTESSLTGLALVRSAHHNSMKRSIVDFFQREAPGEIEVLRPLGDGRFIGERNDAERATLYWLEDGKTKAATLPRRVVQSANKWREENVILNAFRPIQSTTRGALITYNPGFAFWALARDLSATSVNLPGGPVETAWGLSRHMLKTFKPIRDLVYRGKYGRLALEMLDNYAGLLPPNERLHRASEADPDTVLLDLLGKYGMVSPAAEPTGQLWRRALSWPWRQVEKMGELEEKWTKAAAYSYLRERQERGLPIGTRGVLTRGQRSRQLEHVSRLRGATPNYFPRGRWHAFTNAIMLFSNIKKQGWRATIEAMREQGVLDYWSKFLLYGMPKTKLVMLAAAWGWLGDEMEEWFKKVPSHDLANYEIIPLGTTPSGKPVYSRRPTDHAGQAAGVLLYHATDWKNPDYNKNLGEFLLTALPWSLADVHPAVKVSIGMVQFGMGINPYDYFLGRPVIPERFHGASPYGKESWQYLGRWVWNNAGGRMLWEFNTEDVQQELTWLESVGALPVLAPLSRRFVKVSDYGLTEKEIQQGKRAKQSQLRDQNGRDAALNQLIDASPDAGQTEVRYLYEQLRKAGFLDRVNEDGKLIVYGFGDFWNRFETLKARRSPDREVRAKAWR